MCNDELMCLKIRLDCYYNFFEQGINLVQDKRIMNKEQGTMNGLCLQALNIQCLMKKI
jgi:hypothetical protein